MINIKINDIPGVPRLQEVGGGARRGGGAARPQHDARPALLPQLRSSETDIFSNFVKNIYSSEKNIYQLS